MSKTFRVLSHGLTAGALAILASCGGDVAPHTPLVGGSVSGLAGSGLVLQNNGRTDLAVSSNGGFSFGPVLDGAPYKVTVKTQPGSPVQTCTVSNGGGTVGANDVNDVKVDCVTPKAPVYTIGGTISGLTSAPVWLQDNAGDDLPVSANGPFVFPTQLFNGAGYAVTVKTQPAVPLQTCAVTKGTGTVNGANVTNVDITCTTLVAHTVGGTVTGLLSGLVLNDGVDLAVSANGRFVFPNTFLEGATYTVAIKTAPSAPAQQCSIVNGAGTVGQSDITNVSVNCDAPVPPPTYTVGGSVSGLQGSGLVLNDGIDLPIAANGAFAFPATFLEGAAYAVSIKTYPGAPVQSCTVANGAGTVGHGNVTNVAVSCAAPPPAPTYALGGSLGGLQGSGLVLKDGVSGRTMTMTANGSFSFGPRLTSGTAYALTVQTQPSHPPQTCTVSNGSGTIGSADVANVVVTCPPPPHFAFVTSLSNMAVYSLDNTTGAATATGNSVPFGNILPASIALSRFLYIGTVSDNRVHGYAIDPSSGALSEVQGSPFSTGGVPQAVGVLPNGKFVYAANRDNNTVTTFAIDPATGALSQVGLPVATGSFPIAVSPTPDSKFLYVANLVGKSVSVFAVDATSGALSLVATVPNAEGARFIAIDGTGKFLYLTSGQQHATLIYGYAINPSSGVLTPVPGGSFSAGNGVQDMAIDSRGKYLYATNEDDSTISGYLIDATTGALMSMGPALPIAGTLPEGVAVDPNGKFVYAAAQGASNLAVFKIDPSNGSLSASSTSAPSSNRPLSIVILNPQ